MSNRWKSNLPFDPLPALLAWQDPALTYFVQRDLQEQAAIPVETLWELPEAEKLVGKQQANGSWHYPGKNDHLASNANYDLLETYRSLRLLVEMYGFQRTHPSLAMAAEYIFCCQTDERTFLPTGQIHRSQGRLLLAQVPVPFLVAQPVDRPGYALPAGFYPEGQRYRPRPGLVRGEPIRGWPLGNRLRLRAKCRKDAPLGGAGYLPGVKKVF